MFQKVLEVTTKPIIYDGDTGGLPEHFRFMVKNLERAGVSAVIIEDKIGLKRNSLFGTEVEQKQESIKNFTKKITTGKKLTNGNLMIISRIESLILGKPVSDALKRAEKYLSAGSDGIMIHSKSNNPKEIFEFSRKFKKLFPNVPLVSVPSSYNKVKENQLIKRRHNVDRDGPESLCPYSQALGCSYPNCATCVTLYQQQQPMKHYSGTIQYGRPAKPATMCRTAEPFDLFIHRRGFIAHWFRGCRLSRFARRLCMAGRRRVRGNRWG